MSTREFGKQIERMACAYLESQCNMTLQAENFQAAHGEIDLIMQHDTTLAFIEVRYRNHGDGAISVTRDKQRRIIRAATEYLLSKQLYDKIPCRFDVVAVHGQPDQYVFEWLPNAFWHS